MRSIRQVLGRERQGSPEPSVSLDANQSWNTLSTLGAGAVADIDTRGIVYPRTRPVSVEVWFGVDDRWVRGSADAGVRQTRIAGLPILESRQRVGESDVVQTAWADEAGDGQGRIVLDLSNTGDVAVVAAIVVRPRTLQGDGTISHVRATDSLVVVDRRPLLDLGRSAGDVAVAIDSNDALYELLANGDGQRVSHSELDDPNGRASIAAMIPLTPGVDRQIQILDGREASTVAPAPIERVVAGWRAHLQSAAEIDLPALPKHVPVALLSSVLGSVDDAAPLGDESWIPADDSSLAVALSGFGLAQPASHVVERLLDGVSQGRIARSEWPSVAIACTSVVSAPEGCRVLKSYGDIVATVAGDLLECADNASLRRSLVAAVDAAHGAGAASDAAAISVRRPCSSAAALAALGVSASADGRVEIGSGVQGSVPGNTRVGDRVALEMIASARGGNQYEAIVPMRAAAGSTWSWQRDGCGDSPHTRAALLIGLRSLCIDEQDDSVDLIPGFSERWLGQNLKVSSLPIVGGRCSFAIRWHGERPALLWEAEVDAEQPFSMTCRALDPQFSTSERSGEALLGAPTHLRRVEA